MSPTSSNPIQTVGALKQYNLLEDEGSGPTRKVRLTKDALRIVLDKSPNSQERNEAVRRCFLSAKIYKEIWEKWGGDLPSEQTMINHLVLERRLANLAPFSDQGAIELLGNYRASMAFLAPQDADNDALVSESAGEEHPMENDLPTQSKAAAPASSQSQPHTYRQPAERTAQHVAINEAERIVFVEEGMRGQYVKLVVSGELDEITLEALSDYIERQKRRLKLSPLN
jgi:hypothetical protein